MRGPLHTFFLVLIICLVQFFTVATLKILDAGGSGGGTPGPSSGGLDDCVAGDINNDAAVNIADAIYVLSYLFTSGPEPVACAGNPTEVVVTGSADVNVINIPDVAVSGTADVNVTNTPTVNLAGPAEVTVSNTPTVNVGNIADVSIAGTASVQVANVPEVIVTNTADMNVVSIPPVEISSMPLVSDDFVTALGQYFPKAGSYSRNYFEYPVNDPTNFEILLIPGDFVPEGKIYRVTKAIDDYFSGSSNSSSDSHFTDFYFNGVFASSEFSNADFPIEMKSGDVLTVRRTATYPSGMIRRIEIVGYFLDYVE